MAETSDSPSGSRAAPAAAAAAGPASEVDLESAESVALVHEPAPKNGKEEVMSDIGLDDEPALPRQRAELALEGHAEMHSPVREIRSANGYWLARLEQYSDKGTVSNCCTFTIMLIGLLFRLLAGSPEASCGAGGAISVPSPTSMQTLSKYVLAGGLFGFAGGITNWLAVKMLFDRVCNLPGSGVIPMRFKEIREVVKNTIMRTFFDGPYLEKYMKEKMGGVAQNLDLGAKLAAILDSEEADKMITKALDDLMAAPEGMMLMMMNLTPELLKPMIKPFIVSMAREVGPLMGKHFDISAVLPVDKLRTEIDALMTEKLKELTPEKVKQLMEDVIRTHLGWLIVWGNVFGGLIGCVSVFAGYA